tara:strand:- start:13 stop:639 length:627 start_codon:yes stop_codon:yes gene_type:complete
MALARLSVLKDYLNISSTSNDNTLKVLLGAATSIASNYTNRDYLEKPSGTIEEYYSPTNVLNSRLYLRNKPLNTITSVIENFGKTGGDDTVAAGDYEVFSNDGVIRFDDATLTPGYLNVKVTYNPGYDTSDWDTDAITVTFGNVPNDLEYAVMRIAAKLYLDSKKGEGRGGVTSKSRGAESIGYTTEFSQDLPKESVLILDGYTMSQV